ncbi:S-adenosylmethionine:tRNA ribosyltransferase-isomerase [Pradoshia sp.]|uniref:S-adenosylmethionine:tRNA ribosyltransferase-isomerase n=1 Tax=Pradoshia sp. TaxID=2651281 RepID=UPI003F11086E
MMRAVEQPFHLPADLNASSPPEERGLRRDHVKLMVLQKETGAVAHDVFCHLGDYLQKGDLLLLNNSRTLPAVLKTICGKEVRLARKWENGDWDVLVIDEGTKEGDNLHFPGKLMAKVINKVEGMPLWTVSFNQADELFYDWLYRFGEPIRYEYIDTPWELERYQTVYASVPGSTEMPSAGRAFTWELLFDLQKKGVQLGFLQLHTGLSDFLDDHYPVRPEGNPEYYHIPAETLNWIQGTKKEGGRIIAVGTTVVRAVESAILTGKASGFTNLFIGEDYQRRTIDGLLTGFHEADASHLDLLSSFIDSHKLIHAYEMAIQNRYLWHEFGDMNLII